ncbi:hypothetical protein J0A71_03g05110 [Encephalitozoon cuniculi]|nr:hypothetical protein J0A71_03g05110 [Encephalitozoon cuniculi]
MYWRGGMDPLEMFRGRVLAMSAPWRRGGWTGAWFLGCGSEGSSDVLQELCGTPDDWMEKMMAEALRERRRMRAFVMVDL